MEQSMASAMEGLECGDFVFYNNFDSANLAKVEQVVKLQPEESEEPGKPEILDLEGKSSKQLPNRDPPELPQYEFNLWTKHDCHGTVFENNSRTWFHFGIKAPAPGVLVKLNMMNLNKQLKMFSQGMSPVFKTVPGPGTWERLREKPTFMMDQKGSEFTLSFAYRTPESSNTVTYFAFTYPFTYTDLQNSLNKIDEKMAKSLPAMTLDDIYYHRECAIKSIEGRRMDLITISSYHNISMERESRLKNMFPEEKEERPFKFRDKKVIFVSARVHPGETPSSFVLNGLLNFLLTREDEIAIHLRRLYVFKLIPMLNPDGVARGHYRMDTRGVNLNRMYLNPSEKDHPTIYAARNLIKYHHYSYELPEENPAETTARLDFEIGKNTFTIHSPTGSTNVVCESTNRLLRRVTLMTLDEREKGEFRDEATLVEDKIDKSNEKNVTIEKQDESIIDENNEKKTTMFTAIAPDEPSSPGDPENSGLFLYIDLHGHASKKGVFMYGNYFDNPQDTIMCMLLPKLMSINNPNFHFTSCNFAERNMYLVDKRDGMSREGSGRVAVYKLTGLVRSYTLECNYNSGRFVNAVPPKVRDCVGKPTAHIFVPPKYTPAIFEEVGAALGPSILDLTNNNPNSRLPNSPYRSLRGLKSDLKLTYVNNLTASFNKPLQKDTEDVRKDEGKAKKATVLRRTNNLYIRRTKTQKKPRQMPSTRKSLKTQEKTNTPLVSQIIRKRKSIKSKVHTIDSIFGSQLKKYKNLSSKLRANAKSKNTVSEQEEESGVSMATVVVQQGTKRLKVMSKAKEKDPSEKKKKKKNSNSLLIFVDRPKLGPRKDKNPQDLSKKKHKSKSAKCKKSNLANSAN